MPRKKSMPALDSDSPRPARDIQRPGRAKNPAEQVELAAGAPAAAAARLQDAVTGSETRALARRTPRKPSPAAAIITAAAKDVPRTHRELAEAIFAQCDPIAIGRELLASEASDRGSSVKARVWETLVEFLLGKPAPAQKQEPIVQIIWDLPGPQHDPNDP